MAETMGVTEEDTGNNKINPFEQPPILQALFEQIKQLPVEDLIQCRLVNKQWYDETLSTFRSNATLKLNFPKGGIISKRYDGSDFPRLISLGEFLDLSEAGEWGSCPFKKFNFQDVSYFLGYSTDYTQRKRFMKLVGSHITSLTLEEVRTTRYDIDKVRRMIYQAFPKLKFLKIEGYWGYKDYLAEPGEILEYKEPEFGVHGLKSLDISRVSRHSIMDLLTHFHLLENLSLNKIENDEHGHEDYRKLLEVIRLIRAHDAGKLPLKNFDVEFTLELGGNQTASSIQLLRLHDELNFPHQRLRIKLSKEITENLIISNADVISCHVRDILQQYSSQLEHLALYGSDRHGLFKLFPFGVNLEKLEELVLVIRSSRFTDNLNYLKYTPNLRALEITDKDFTLLDSDIFFSNSSQLEIGDWTLPSLTDLRFELPLSVWSLRKLMKWMPNVERLYGLKLDNVKFSMICNSWRNLKHLEDWGHELTDAGVLRIGFEAVGDGHEETQRASNISKLQNLTSFKSSSYKLTPALLQDEFIKLANLKKLTLWELRLDEKAIHGLRNPDIKPEVRYGEWW